MCNICIIFYHQTHISNGCVMLKRTLKAKCKICMSSRNGLTKTMLYKFSKSDHNWNFSTILIVVSRLMSYKFLISKSLLTQINTEIIIRAYILGESYYLNLKCANYQLYCKSWQWNETTFRVLCCHKFIDASNFKENVNPGVILW